MEPELARLAAVALNDEGRRIAEQACTDLEALGNEQWIERYDRLAEDLSDEPSDAEILVVPALLRAIDDHLAAAGLRLLIIDLDSDMYNFVPVAADAFAALVGQTSDDFSLRAVDPNPS